MAVPHDHSWPHEAQEQLSRQLSRLGHDVAAISRTVERQGTEVGRGAGSAAAELADAAWRRGERVARRIRRQAKRAGGAIHKDPVPGIVAVAGILLLLNLLLGRKR